MREVYVGADPGKAGCITIKDGNKFTHYYLPIVKETKDVDLKQLIRDAATTRVNFKKGKIFGVLEQVNGRGIWSASSNFNFGKVFGYFELFLTIVCDEFVLERPAKWQSFCKRGKNFPKGMDSKLISIQLAQEFYPDADLTKSARAKKADDNKVDSILLAHYAENNSKKLFNVD